MPEKYSTAEASVPMQDHPLTAQTTSPSARVVSISFAGHVNMPSQFTRPIPGGSMDLDTRGDSSTGESRPVVVLAERDAFKLIWQDVRFNHASLNI